MLSPLWGLLKDLHLVLSAVCGDHKGTVVAKMQKSTRGLASILILVLLIEQPLLKHGIRIRYVGGGVQSEDSGFMRFLHRLYCRRHLKSPFRENIKRCSNGMSRSVQHCSSLQSQLGQD